MLENVNQAPKQRDSGQYSKHPKHEGGNISADDAVVNHNRCCGHLRLLIAIQERHVFPSYIEVNNLTQLHELIYTVRCMRAKLHSRQKQHAPNHPVCDMWVTLSL